jgi:periplasmic divalent cation tolerance protein
MSEHRLVLSTLPDDERAKSIARTLCEERLAACVNLVPKITSIYRWQGEISEDAEVLAFIKTRAETVPALTKRMLELHPYECPEVIAIDITSGHDAYLAWVGENSRGK